MGWRWACCSLRADRAQGIDRGRQRPSFVFLIVLAPGVYFNLQAGGSIFPNTFYAKQSEYGELLRTLPIWLNSIGSMLIAPLAGGVLLLMPGVVCG